MLYIVHGSNVTASRNFILDLFKKTPNSVKKEIDIDSVEPVDLDEVLNMVDMFGNKQFVVLDISKLGNKNIEPYLPVIRKCPQESILVIFADKNLPKTNALMKVATEIKAKEMAFATYPKGNVFRFLDFVFAADRKQAYSEYQKLIADDANVFYIFTMLIYSLRNLAYFKLDLAQKSQNSPSAKAKLVSLEKNYTVDGVRKLYSILYSYDKKVKIGEMDMELLIPLSMEKIFECHISSPKNI